LMTRPVVLLLWSPKVDPEDFSSFKKRTVN
jgi:hypothetical protein